MRYLLILSLLFSLSFSNTQTIKIGVLAKRGAEVTHKKWDHTAEYLTQKIEGKTFEILPISFEEIFKKVENKEIDFILANSGFYVELEYKYGAQRISTLINKHLSGLTQNEFGGLLITHIDNVEKYNHYEDLINTDFIAVNEKSLGGWQMAWRELVQNGVNRDDLKSLAFKGTHDKVVHAIINKEADIGTVRSDTIERMAIEGKIDLNKLHFVALKVYDNFPFLTSTKLYPEWPIAKLKHTPEVLSKKVAIALMQMSEDDKASISANIAGWTTPLSYQPVHDCFKFLKIPPYYQEIKFIDVLAKYKYWILFYLALAFGAITMFLYQLRLTDQLKSTQDDLVQTEKMASLGRLVAGVAHEINTPIGVGVTAASHLQKETTTFHKDYLDENVTQNAFEAYMDTSLKGTTIILDNLSRASDLIQSFKQISVDQTSDETRIFNLHEYIQSIINSLRPVIKNTQYNIELICDESIVIDSNPGVFSQIFSNLIMNSILHGFEGRERGIIIISILLDNHNNLTITYKDDGLGMSKEAINQIFDPFFTTKRGSGGSGLGANIIYNLVTQKLNGSIKVQSELGKGLMFTMNFKGLVNV